MSNQYLRKAAQQAASHSQMVLQKFQIAISLESIPGVRWMAKNAFDARASQHWDQLRQNLQSLHLADSATVHWKTEPTM